MLLIKSAKATEDRVFERVFADSQIRYMKIKRRKPRREEQSGSPLQADSPGRKRKYSIGSY